MDSASEIWGENFHILSCDRLVAVGRGMFPTAEGVMAFRPGMTYFNAGQPATARPLFIYKDRAPISKHTLTEPDIEC